MAQQPVEDGPDITNYWQYFHLHRDPFAMNADKDLYFVPTKWEEILDLLQYISHYKNQLMLVAGDNGAGKTTLAELLLSQIGDTMYVGRIAAENSFDVSRLIELISDCFSVSWRPEQPLEQMLDEELTALQQKDRPSLLVIDNAHLLPFETLEALLYLVGQQSEHQMHFHVLLLAEPSLSQTFQRLLEPDEEGLLHTTSLIPLSMDETALYLGHRLAVAGWQEDFPLTDEMITRIYRLSEGNPARINRIARRALLDMLTQDKQEKKNGFIQRYGNKLIGSGVLVVVLVIGASWLLHNGQQASKGSDTALNAQNPTISLNGQALNTSVDGNSQVALPLPEALKAPAAGATAAAPTVPGADVPMPAAPPAIPAMPQGGAAPQSVTPTSVAPTGATEPQPIILTAKGPEASQLNVAKAPANAKVASINTAVDASSAEMAPSPAAGIASEVMPASEPVASAKSDVKPVSEPVVTAKSEVKPTLAVKKALIKEKAKPKLSYGLELLGVKSTNSLATLLKSHPELQHQLTIVRGKSGAIKVFYGRYASLNAASKALTTVPASLADEKLWPNKMSSAKGKSVKKK